MLYKCLNAVISNVFILVSFHVVIYFMSGRIRAVPLFRSDLWKMSSLQGEDHWSTQTITKTNLMGVFHNWPTDLIREGLFDIFWRFDYRNIPLPQNTFSFNTVFEKGCYLMISCDGLMQSTCSQTHTHTHTHKFSKIHSNSFPWMLGSPNWSLLLRYSHWNCVRTSPLSMRAKCPTHHLLLFKDADSSYCIYIRRGMEG
jgi:hypothetical protein